MKKLCLNFVVFVVVACIVAIVGCGSVSESSEELLAEESVEESVSESVEESLAEEVTETPMEEEQGLSDEDFLTNLVAGIEERWMLGEQYSEDEIAEMSTYSLGKYYESLVNAETEALGQIEDYNFNDENLKELAETYYKGVKLQEDGVEYIGSGDEASLTDTWDTGYYLRASVIGNIYNYYNLPISEKYKSDWEEFVSFSESAEAALENGLEAGTFDLDYCANYAANFAPNEIEAKFTQVEDNGLTVMVGQFKNVSGHDIRLNLICNYGDESGEFWGTGSFTQPLLRAGEEYIEVFDIGENYQSFQIDYDVEDVVDGIYAHYDATEVQTTRNGDNSIGYNIISSDPDGYNLQIKVFYLDDSGRIIGYDHVDVGGSGEFGWDSFTEPSYDYSDYVVSWTYWLL